MKKIIMLIIILFAFIINAYDLSFILTDNPRKEVFFSGELDIVSLGLSPLSSGLDSIIYSGINTYIDYRALLPFGIEFKIFYDTNNKKIGLGPAFNYLIPLMPVSSRTYIEYRNSRNLNTAQHSFSAGQIIMIDLISIIKAYYEIAYESNLKDGCMKAGAMIALPFEIMYFEKLAIVFEDEFFTFTNGIQNRFLTGIYMTTWGHQFAITLSRFNTYFPYEYTGLDNKFYFGFNIKRNFDF